MIESFEKIIDPNFINAELIGQEGAERVVTIKDIDYAECFDQKTKGKVTKQTLFFEECKPLVLNKTNARTLKKLFSPNTDDPRLCIGHKIILYVTSVKVGGQMTTGIRIKEYSEVKCDECDQVIVPYAGKTVDQLMDISKRNFNKCLCGNCMKKKGEESNGK